MSITRKKVKIATILPYKENYTFGKASAASLWVAEFFLNSKFKNNKEKKVNFSVNEISLINAKFKYGNRTFNLSIQKFTKHLYTNS